MRNFISFIRKLKNNLNSKDKSKLSILVEQEKESRKKSKFSSIAIKQLMWYPSKKTVLKIFIILIFFWFFSHPIVVYNWIITPIDNVIDYLFGERYYIRNFLSCIFNRIPFLKPVLIYKIIDPTYLFSTLAGIGAVLIGLTFFIAQSLTDKGDPEKGRILLYKSNFFPLLTTEILMFCFLIWGKINIIGIIPILFLAAWTIKSITDVIKILVQDYEFEKAKLEMFTSILKTGFLQILDWEANRRLGNNILYEKYKNSKIVLISPYSPFNKNQYIPIRSYTNGILTDISFDRLDQLLLELTSISNDENPLSHDPIKTISNEESSKSNINQLCWIPPKYYKDIKQNDVVMWVRKNIFDFLDPEDKTKELKSIEALLRNVFEIKKIKDPRDETRFEVLKLKDRCIRAIDNKRTGELEKIINLYIELVKEFFKFLESQGGGFTREQAENERNQFFERLKPVNWLSEDIEEIIERGFNSKNLKIIEIVVYLPVLLSRHAIENKEHLIFQEFIYFPRFLYKFALNESKENNIELSTYMLDRSWRFLRELTVYYLEPKIDDEDYIDENYDNLKGFAIHIYKVFQDLMLSTINNNDHKHFEKLLAESQKLFHNTIRKSYNDSEILKYLIFKKKQMYFGLASWCLYKFENNIQIENYKQFLGLILNKLPNNILDLTELFEKCYQINTERFWGWSNWELWEKEEGEVHIDQTLFRIKKIYIIKSLMILSKKSSDDIKKINLTSSREFSSFAQNFDIIGIIDNIKENKDDWNFILNDSSINKGYDFKQLLEKTVEQQNQKERNELINRRISSNKIDQFKKELIDGFNKAEYLRLLLKDYFSSYEIQINEPTSKTKKYELNHIDNKAVFIEKWHENYVGWGANYGRNIARIDNAEIFKLISQNCIEIDFESVNEKLKDFSNLQNMVMLVSNYGILRNNKFNNIFNFKHSFQVENKVDINCFAGTCELAGKSINVFNAIIGINNGKSEILILDKTRFGKLIQYSSLDDIHDKNTQDIFFIDVKSFSEDDQLMNETINNNPPDWLLGKGDEAEQREYLQQKVLIHVLEKFEFIKQKDFIGYKIILQ